MLAFSGYQITKRIHETSRSIVYRAIRSADNAPVVLKVLNSEYPTPHELARYRQEHDLLGSLSSPGVIEAYGIENIDHTTFLVLEDIGGVSLDQVLREQRPSLDQSLDRFVDLAIQMSMALAHVHQRGIIHKDVNPSNMVWNQQSNRLQLIDFGLATRFSKESPAFKSPTLLEGTLPYISPEQTGRVNRHLDYRTDLYSLGVTFYELLTGQRPFPSADALELVHCHIAAQPRAPIELRPDLPPLLSRMVMKLMAKTAEDRYQSAWGLKVDLERFRHQRRSGPDSVDFPLAREDISDRFEIPQKLYGRSAEIQTLMQAFARISRGSRELVQVTGYSGIGKSSVVRELYKPITENNAFFLHGKFDLLQRAKPYSAIPGTFSPLVKQLLTGSKDELHAWRQRLTAALGPNGHILGALIPDLQLVIGPQPEAEDLSAMEARTRVHLAFCSFLRVFCRPEHPLVVFLDDLQWADPATLALLEPVMTDGGIEHLLVIGAYRDNEVDGTHPLAGTLAKLADKQVAMDKIHLEPLALEGVAQLLADTLHRPVTATGSLAELVLHKTEGNPFFIREFLNMLHREKLLRFAESPPGWSWDIAEIEAAQVTDNVAALLSTKLSHLPQELQMPLQMAACMGSHFDLDAIALICRQPVADTHAQLMAAVREGFIHPVSEPDAMLIEGRNARLFVREYQFVHDRVQHAAYDMIPAQRRRALHLDIGRLLLAALPPDQRAKRLFELVDHLNLGRDLLDTLTGPDRVSPRELARLNLQAGQRAKDAAAHAAAARYLASGIELAGEAWDEDYDLIFALYLDAAQMEHCQGQVERSQALIDLASRKARTPVDHARLYQILIIQHTNLGKHPDALEAGRAALRMLGQALPEPDRIAAEVERERADIDRILRTLAGTRGEPASESASEPALGSAIEALLEAPEMSDEVYRATVGILGALVPTVFQAYIELSHLVSARLVRLSLEHGHTVEGALGYAVYGLVLGSATGDYQQAYRFGALAMRLADRLRSASAKCRVGKVVMAYIHPWARPLGEATALSAGLYEAALQSGEIQYAAFLLLDRLANQFYLGVDLQRVLDEAAPCLQFSKNNHNTVAETSIEAIMMAAAYLRDTGDTDIPRLDDDAAFVDRCHRSSCFYALGMYYALKCQALYLMQDHEGALAAARDAETMLDHIQGVLSVAFINFYCSLSMAALYTGAAPEQQRVYLQAMESRQAQMKVWMESCPHNFAPMYFLVAAEMARITGEEFAAARHYLQAIEAAERSELRHDLALAHELAALFWLTTGQTRYARQHLKDARYGYARWGAKRKLALLETQHAALLMSLRGDSAGAPEPSSQTRHPESAAGTIEQLDLSSVIKASQALSREITLDKLLARLIGVVIENAGAQQGHLILKRKDRLVVEACGAVDQHDVTVLQSLPLQEERGDSPPLVSTAVINYVMRSRETVVLHDAAHEGPFVHDRYIASNATKSILCMPLLKHGEVEGVIFLENNLSTKVFTPERVALLEILSSQMMISLDNSLLYDNLQRATRDLERLLYSIAHDLKEPLRSIQSFSELLLHRYDAHIDDRGRDYLKRIIQAGQRLGTLLDATRTISEIRRRESEFLPVPGELLVQDATKRLLPLIEKSGARIRMAEDLPMLTVDRDLAAEAVYQLLHNALQFARGHGAPRPALESGPESKRGADIDILPYRGSEGVGLIVQDRGPGIPPECAEQVFDLFRRAVGREVVGTGAGLAIVRQIAVKHGGTTWIDARPGGGAEIYITFGS